ALVLLQVQHRTLLDAFRAYERQRKTATPLAKGKSALRACHSLTMHNRLKHELFYPAVMRVLGKGAEALLADARLDDDIASRLGALLEQTPVGHPLFDPLVKLLAGHAKRHFAEEEARLFSRIRGSRLDLAGLGEQMASRELELGTERPGK